MSSTNKIIKAGVKDNGDNCVLNLLLMKTTTAFGENPEQGVIASVNFDYLYNKKGSFMEKLAFCVY
jgi:hypothetical protein